MKYLFLVLVIFFVHVKFDLLILVSGYDESVVNLNFLYFIIFIIITTVSIKSNAFTNI